VADRYRLPDPQCKHARRGIVRAGDPAGAYASTQVCDRDECITDAMAWATASVHEPAEHVRDADRKAANAEPTLWSPEVPA
jgi:hypothetical protein